MMGHGRHIKIVGYGSAKLLGSVDVVRDFLMTLVRKLGMRPLGFPMIHDVDIDLSKMNVEPFEDEGGVTGIIVLSTSHCSIHTWPAREKPMFVLDVYSCRDFNAVEVADHACETLGVTALHATDLSLSLRTPDEVGGDHVWGLISTEEPLPRAPTPTNPCFPPPDGEPETEPQLGARVRVTG